MNIFILDRDIEKSVQYHIDAHVIKMPLEAAQMISTTLAVCNTLGYVPRALTREETAAVRVSPIYKPSYHNHPCTIWARSSLENYQYLIQYCVFLGHDEKLHRYPKQPPHKSSDLVLELAPDVPNNLPSMGLTTFAMAMPDDYKSQAIDPIDAYRAYYFCEKVYNRAGNLMAKWTNRNQPEWWKCI